MAYSNQAQITKYKSGFGSGVFFKNPKGSSPITVSDGIAPGYSQQMTYPSGMTKMPVKDTWKTRG